MPNLFDNRRKKRITPKDVKLSGLDITVIIQDQRQKQDTGVVRTGSYLW
jgi:hypothetical protein